MTVLVVGLIVFLGIHSISIVAPAFRDRIAARIGAGPWRGIYSLISIAGFVLIIWGYGLARREPVLLYSPPFWTRYVTSVLMLPVFPMLFAPYFPGRIKAALKHPMLVAVKLWAVAHLISNGMLADVVLFGAFLAWAVADRISYKHRVPRPLKGAPPSGRNDVIVVIVGLVLYVAFLLWLHLKLIGVQPIPLADMPILTTLQSLLVGLIVYVSGRRASARLIAEFAGALGVNIGAGFVFREGARALLKIFPVWGNAISGIVAGAGTYAVGRAAIAYFIEDLPIQETKKLFRKLQPGLESFKAKTWPLARQSKEDSFEK